MYSSVSCMFLVASVGGTFFNLYFLFVAGVRPGLGGGVTPSLCFFSCHGPWLCDMPLSARAWRKSYSFPLRVVISPGTWRVWDKPSPAHPPLGQLATPRAQGLCCSAGDSLSNHGLAGDFLVSGSCLQIKPASSIIHNKNSLPTLTLCPLLFYDSVVIHGRRFDDSQIFKR